MNLTPLSQKLLQRCTLLLLAGALPVLYGCGKTASLFYVDEDTQAIQRDTITASGVKSTIQNPQDKANGIIKLAPVESLGLQPVTVNIPAGYKEPPFDQGDRTLNVPAGFAVDLYAYDLGRPRDLILRDDGVLIYSDFDGRIVAISPDGTKTVLAQDLESPHGLEFHNGALYYVDETRMFKYTFSSPASVEGTSQLMTDRIPKGGEHYTRTLRWSDDDNRFYISIGATSEGPEDDREHATVMGMQDKAGERPSVAMRGGLRNTIGMDTHPVTGELWGIDQGTADLSVELGPEEINILKIGKSYGFPYYYSQNFRNPNYKDVPEAQLPRQLPEAPVIELQAYSTPIDLEFYESDALGADWKNSMLITYHGYFNRDPKTGYKVIRLRADSDGSNAKQADFVTGWLLPTQDDWGTPTGIAIARDGKTFYIADDKHGLIYKVYKR